MIRSLIAGFGAAVFATSAFAQATSYPANQPDTMASIAAQATVGSRVTAARPGRVTSVRQAYASQPVFLGLPIISAVPLAQPQSRTEFDAAIARHAALNGLPESLVHRVVKRESGYRSGVVSKGNYGLMQIRHATARGIGYTGSAAGLLDPETNLTYAVRYLAGAYRVAGGNQDRAVRLYASGYYYEARRQGRGN
jgi:soluble lytic murein transglycosylase-like protein